MPKELKIIRHDLKCIFIHINKTGGTSVVDALSMLQCHLSVELIFSDELSQSEQYQSWGGWGKSDKRSLVNWDQLENLRDLWEDYLSFTIVRNPWDRAVSDFVFCKKQGFLAEDVSFKQDLLSNLDSEKLWKRPCYDWISLNGEIAVDEILKFENLEADFFSLCSQLGLRDVTLPHLNRTEHKPYAEYYDAEARQIVAERYRKDIEVFGYEFGK